MPAQLLALSEGTNILVDKPILLFGRHPECDIQLNSRKVSRRHCCLAQVQDYLVVRDLGSTNGIRINGVRVLEGRVAPGDELTIGNFRYQVVWEGPGGPPSEKRAKADLPASIASRSDDDSYLEEADEPVALTAVPRGKVLPGVAVDSRSSVKPIPILAETPKPELESPTEDSTDHLVLIPDNLTLLPPIELRKHN